jgi:hypothetical protein
LETGQQRLFVLNVLISFGLGLKFRLCQIILMVPELDGLCVDLSFVKRLNRAWYTRDIVSS